MTTTTTILLVEDDVRLADLIQEYLQQEGFIIHVEHRGDTAVQRIKVEQPDLVILDIMLPGLDGMNVCRQVRPYYDNPILMLTARDEDIDQVLGLELGADDYVIKPARPRVLLARIQNLLRRHQHIANTQIDSSKQLIIADLQINLLTRTVQLADRTLDLSNQEFELLHLLASNAGTILSRDKILSSLSGTQYDGLDRSVDIRIARLRKLLNDNPAQPRYIKTIRSKGYLFLS